MTEPQVYTIDEVAVIFRLTAAGVRKLIRENRWPTPVVKVGTRTRIPAAAVNRLLDEQWEVPA